MSPAINIKRAHILSGVETDGKTTEVNSITTFSVRIPLTAHAKRKLGIPPEHKAVVMLLVSKEVSKG